MKVAIAADHAGFEYKKILIDELIKKKLDYKDFGTNDSSSVDYPIYAHLVSNSILKSECSVGILICGSGIGVSIAANRYNKIRAAVCTSGLEAKLARQHNDSNILCIGARIIGISQAIDCMEHFLSTEFIGGRHQDRINMLDQANPSINR